MPKDHWRSTKRRLDGLPLVDREPGATAKQMGYLRVLGVPAAEVGGLTLRQASEMIGKLKAGRAPVGLKSSRLENNAGLSPEAARAGALVPGARVVRVLNPGRVGPGVEEAPF